MTFPIINNNGDRIGEMSLDDDIAKELVTVTQYTQTSPRLDIVFDSEKKIHCGSFSYPPKVS